MDAAPFRRVVQVQLALEKKRTSRPFPHDLTGAEIIEMLLGSMSQRLLTGTMWAAVLIELQNAHSAINLQNDLNT